MILNSHSLRIIDASQPPPPPIVPLPPQQTVSSNVNREGYQTVCRKLNKIIHARGRKKIFYPFQLFLMIYNYSIKELAIPLLLCHSTNEIGNKRKEGSNYLELQNFIEFKVTLLE
jgi:hypothetical protein